MNDLVEFKKAPKITEANRTFRLIGWGKDAETNARTVEVLIEYDLPGLVAKSWASTVLRRELKKHFSKDALANISINVYQFNK